VLEMMALYRQGPAEARARREHDHWKSKKSLNDLIGTNTEKWSPGKLDRGFSHQAVAVTVRAGRELPARGPLAMGYGLTR
jgi:hypothetical protein